MTMPSTLDVVAEILGRLGELEDKLALAALVLTDADRVDSIEWVGEIVVADGAVHPRALACRLT